MGRLIDANSLLELYNGLEDKGLMIPVDVLIQNIKDEPTAYDIDKVVEQLKEQENENGALAEMDWYAGLSQGFHEAIEIVKGGLDESRNDSTSR